MKKFLFSLVCCTLCCGCLFTPQKDDSQFYALGFKHLGTKGSTCDAALKIVCINIEEVPAYADVSQFISLKDGCEIVRSESLRWGEPFKVSVARSLYVGLSHQLKDAYLVVSSPLKVSQNCEYRVNVKVTNFIFDRDKKEVYLTAVITILKHDKPYLICDYSDCFKTSASSPKSIVNGMDWALNTMSIFIGRCLNVSQSPVADGADMKNFEVDSNSVELHKKSEIVPTEKISSSDKDVVSKNLDERADTKIPEITENPTLIQQIVSALEPEQPECASSISEIGGRTIELVAHGEVYVVVDSDDGNVRYFSGRLYDGSSVNVKCDGPFRVVSTNDSLLEVR